MAEINRPAFEALVKQKSPLSLQRFESLFVGVDESNKSLAWKLLTANRDGQRLIGLVKLFFPDATILDITG